jgi:hypothetical protein
MVPPTQSWPLLSGIKDPVEAYETMTCAAQTAEVCSKVDDATFDGTYYNERRS